MITEDNTAGFHAPEIDDFIISLHNSNKRKFVMLNSKEKRLLALIGKQSIYVLHMFPRYWAKNLDIVTTLERLIFGGFLEVYVNYESLTIPDIKELLKIKSLPTKGRKADLLKILDDNFEYAELFDNPKVPKQFRPTKKHEALYLFEHKKLENERESMHN